MIQDDRQRIKRLLQAEPGIRAAWLFGSLASERATRASDLDIAVLGEEPLSAEQKLSLIEHLAQETGRPVDLIDLRATHGPVVDRVLGDGTRLFCDDTTLYAELLQRWWLERADWRPYRRRILKERRERWIEN